MQIKIRYHNPNLNKIEKIDNGDWVDLRAAEDVEMKPGDFKIISLGVSMELPDGYEANIVPRSSTYKKFGLLQTNSFGVIDNSYSGDDDVWGFPAYAPHGASIHVNDRICQFRINKRQPEVDIIEVEHLGNINIS